MRARSFEWDRSLDPDARELAASIRGWARGPNRQLSLAAIEDEVAERGDLALADLTVRFDATELRGPEEDNGASARWRHTDGTPWSIRVDPGRTIEALSQLDTGLRESLELAAGNIENVARAQLGSGPSSVKLAQGQEVKVREVPVATAGIYVPGGGASYPSSLLMAAVPARVAGVSRIVVATPPEADGQVDSAVLAAAGMCGIEEVYAVGGAQAVFALARGTESIAPVDVIAGPGNDWVQAAKRAVFGEVGIDSIAGPSELMVAAGPDSDTGALALDLCAQAEHGDGGLLVAAAGTGKLIDRIAAATEEVAAEWPGVGDAPLALVEVRDEHEVVALAEALAPEHLQVDLDRDPVDPGLPGPVTREVAACLTRPGCVFLGPFSATAFGDYVAGSNHILPTGGAGRFVGPLGPSTFTRRISNVVIGPGAAAILAPHVDRMAQAEGLPIHAESALARARVEGRG